MMPTVCQVYKSLIIKKYTLSFLISKLPFPGRNESSGSWNGFWDVMYDLAFQHQTSHLRFPFNPGEVGGKKCILIPNCLLVVCL